MKLRWHQQKIQFPVSQHLNTCRDTCRHAPFAHTQKGSGFKRVKMHWSNISPNVQQAENVASEQKKPRIMQREH